jgi:hypothetical protein
MTDEWGSWQEDRRYLAKGGEHEVIVYRREQSYGGEKKTFWKNERRRVRRSDRTELLYRAAMEEAD